MAHSLPTALCRRSSVVRRAPRLDDERRVEESDSARARQPSTPTPDRHSSSVVSAVPSVRSASASASAPASPTPACLNLSVTRTRLPLTAAASAATLSEDSLNDFGEYGTSMVNSWHCQRSQPPLAVSTSARTQLRVLAATGLTSASRLTAASVRLCVSGATAAATAASRMMRIGCTGEMQCGICVFEVRKRSVSSMQNFAKGSVESTHKVPTSHYHTKHCHAAVVSLGGLTHR